MKLTRAAQSARRKVDDILRRFVTVPHVVDRQIAPRVDGLRRIAGSVDDSMTEIEARFVEISAAVEAGTKTAQELVEHGEALISLALGQGGGQIVIEMTAEQIWRAVEFVERNVEGGKQLIAQLNEAHTQMGPMLASEGVLVRTLAPLVYVQTLIRVESSGLSPEVQTMFHALVRDIEEIHKRVKSEFHERFEMIREIQAILGQAIAVLTARQTEATRTITTLRGHLALSLDRMKQGYEKNRDRNAGLAAVSHAVAKDTGNVVISLQFYDILSQKIQHAKAILGEVSAATREIPSEKVQALRRLRFIEQGSRVCGAQIGAINDELKASSSALGEGLRSIIGHMESLNNDCIALRDLDNVTTGVEGAVQILLDSLTEMQQLVLDAQKFAIESYQSIEPISGRTTNFTSFIRNLSHEIQLIGLNAEVQSAHVGQGTGLEVLSAQASEISRETSRLSTSLAEQLDTFTARLAQIVSSFKEVRDKSSEFNTEFAAESASAAGSLHDYRDSAFKVLMHIGGLLPSLQSSIKEAIDKSDFSGVVSQPLQSLQESAEDLANAAKAAADSFGAPEDAGGLTEHFLKIYTMSDEGRVHRKALGIPEPAAPPAASPASGDIDLFGFDAPLSEVAPPSPSKPPEASLGDVTLWDEAPPAPTEPPKTPPDDSQTPIAA